MGIGMALFEELAYDSRGIPQNASLSRYHVVNAPDMPQVKVMLIEEDEPTGPFGAKSVGEIAAVPVTPAIVNAVNWAIGISINVLPLTPSRIISALGAL